MNTHGSVPSSVVLAVDPSWSTPEQSSVAPARPVEQAETPLNTQFALLDDYYRLAHEADNAEQKRGAWNEVVGIKQEIEDRLAALTSEVARLTEERDEVETTIRNAAYLMARRLEGASLEDSYVEGYHVLFEHLYPDAARPSPDGAETDAR